VITAPLAQLLPFHARAPSSSHSLIRQTARDDVPESPTNAKFVLIVEDDDDLRELFVLLITVFLERRAVGVASYEALIALGEEALKCGAAILDINLGPSRQSGIDAYKWLRRAGYKGRIAFLTGHASNHPLVVEAQRLGDAEIFTKPIEANQLGDLVEGQHR